MPLFIRMNDISDLDFLIPDTAIIDKANETVIQIDPILQMRGVLRPAIGNQLSGQGKRLVLCFQLGHHKGSGNRFICDQSHQRLQILLRIGFQLQALCLDPFFLLNR